MKKVFLVSTEKGTKIISENVLVKELKEVIKARGSKCKTTEVEKFVAEALAELDGKSMDNETYEAKITEFATALIKYSELTPYTFYITIQNKAV